MEYTYNPSLVALAIVFAILGSFTGLVMTAGIRLTSGALRSLLIFLGALGIGGGIRSMHFIAMLAVILPTGLSHDASQTVVSALIAVSFTSLAPTIVASNRFGNATRATIAVTARRRLAFPKEKTTKNSGADRASLRPSLEPFLAAAPAAFR